VPLSGARQAGASPHPVPIRSAALRRRGAYRHPAPLAWTLVVGLAGIRVAYARLIRAEAERLTRSPSVLAPGVRGRERVKEVFADPPSHRIFLQTVQMRRPTDHNLPFPAFSDLHYRLAKRSHDHSVP